MGSVWRHGTLCIDRLEGVKKPHVAWRLQPGSAPHPTLARPPAPFVVQAGMRSPGLPTVTTPGCRSACSISYTTSRRASTQRRKKWRWAARSRIARQAQQAQQALQARRVQRVHQAAAAAAAAAAAVAAAALAATPLRREPPLTSKGTWQTLAAGGPISAACTGQLVYFEGTCILLCKNVGQLQPLFATDARRFFLARLWWASVADTCCAD